MDALDANASRIHRALDRMELELLEPLLDRRAELAAEAAGRAARLPADEGEALVRRIGRENARLVARLSAAAERVRDGLREVAAAERLDAAYGGRRQRGGDES